jgi:hypothetical protein
MGFLAQRVLRYKKSEMKSISINGQKLHEVRMLLQPYDNNTISYLQYPKHRIIFDVDENTVVIKLPSMLSLELFRLGVLTPDKNEQIKLSISGKSIGKYVIDDFRYPKDHSDIISVHPRK